MFKLKDLLFERTMSTSDFMKNLNAAKKEPGAKDKIPAGTKRLCNEVQKAGFHKIDYRGKVGLARKPKEPFYQYYEYASSNLAPYDRLISLANKSLIINFIL